MMAAYCRIVCIGCAGHGNPPVLVVYVESIQSPCAQQCILLEREPSVLVVPVLCVLRPGHGLLHELSVPVVLVLEGECHVVAFLVQWRQNDGKLSQTVVYIICVATEPSLQDRLSEEISENRD